MQIITLSLFHHHALTVSSPCSHCFITMLSLFHHHALTVSLSHFVQELSGTTAGVGPAITLSTGQAPTSSLCISMLNPPSARTPPAEMKGKSASF
jgi:hypothetical protein